MDLEGLIPSERARAKHCKGCMYLTVADNHACCDYILKTGKRRPNPFGVADCAAKTEGEHIHNWRGGHYLLTKPEPKEPHETQKIQILRYLAAGNTLTPLESVQLFGCQRLGARIWDIKAMMVPVISELIAVGKNKHVSRYHIDMSDPATRKLVEEILQKEAKSDGS